MRLLLLIPFAMMLTAAGGLALTRLAGWAPHPREMLTAGAVSLVAAAGAGAVCWRSRGQTQPGVAQAALIGLSLQMFVSLALCGALYVVGIPIQTPFALWLLAFYWATLVILAAAFVQVLRAAPPEPVGQARH